MTKTALKLLISFGLLFSLGVAEAATISKVSGKRALIALEGLEVQAGTELFALGADQKRKALIKIVQVKGDRAIGEIAKGAAQPGMVLILKGSPPAPVAAPSMDAPADDSGGSSTRRVGTGVRAKNGFGLLFGLANSSMAFTAKRGTVQEDLSLSGNSFNLKAIYDYNLSKAFTIRGAAGLETLVVKGTTTQPTLCSDSASCNLGINYLGLEGAAQFNIINSGLRWWVGGGFSFLLAMSKSTSVSSLEIAGTNQALFLGTGFDIGVGKTAYIPITVEYGLYPFAGVKLSGIYIRGGYGWKF